MNTVFEFRTLCVRYNYTQLVAFLFLGDPPPGNHPKEWIQHLEHSESLQSGICNLHTLYLTKIRELLYFFFLKSRACSLLWVLGIQINSIVIVCCNFCTWGSWNKAGVRCPEQNLLKWVHVRIGFGFCEKECNNRNNIGLRKYETTLHCK
jgi:hypothetical protein